MTIVLAEEIAKSIKDLDSMPIRELAISAYYSYREGKLSEYRHFMEPLQLCPERYREVVDMSPSTELIDDIVEAIELRQLDRYL